jgi:hypothetical protein
MKNRDNQVCQVGEALVFSSLLRYVAPNVDSISLYLIEEDMGRNENRG